MRKQRVAAYAVVRSERGLLLTEFSARTGWTLNERGLYRTLKRLAASDLLAVESVPVERTGLPRKDYRLTDLGEIYLARLEYVLRTVG